MSVQMASAIRHMHAFGIMHRDVKGENFLFARDPVKVAEKGGENVVKLIDLGMAAEYNPKEVIKGELDSWPHLKVPAMPTALHQK